MSFIDDNCVVFDARQDEVRWDAVALYFVATEHCCRSPHVQLQGELHHTELHMQFTELVEKLLESQLAELGISPDGAFRARTEVETRLRTGLLVADFAAIVLRSGQESPLFRLLSTHLLALDGKPRVYVPPPGACPNVDCGLGCPLRQTLRLSGGSW